MIHHPCNGDSQNGSATDGPARRNQQTSRRTILGAFSQDHFGTYNHASRHRLRQATRMPTRANTMEDAGAAASGGRPCMFNNIGTCWHSGGLPQSMPTCMIVSPKMVLRESSQNGPARCLLISSRRTICRRTILGFPK